MTLFGVAVRKETRDAIRLLAPWYRWPPRTVCVVPHQIRQPSPDWTLAESGTTEDDGGSRDEATVQVDIDHDRSRRLAAVLRWTIA